MKLRKWGLPLAFATAAACAMLWVSSKGGVATVFNQPPQAEPVAGGAFYLERIQRENNSTGHWIMVVRSGLVTGVQTSPLDRWPRYVFPPDAFRALATDSTGQQSDLGWSLRKPDGPLDGYSFNANGEPDLMFVTLPQAWPPDVKWVDVTLQNKAGQSAKWRIKNLQFARHTLSDEPVKSSIVFDGITVSAKAERFFVTGGSRKVPYLDCTFDARGQTLSGQHWNVRFAGFNREWEMPAQKTWQGTEDNRHFPIDAPEIGLHAQGYFSAFQQDFGSKPGHMDLMNQWIEFYPQRNRFARCAGAFVLIQKNGKEEREVKVVPFVLKVPITFRPNNNPWPKAPTPKASGSSR